LPFRAGPLTVTAELQSDDYVVAFVGGSA
jgi:hypothetical protein